MSALKAKFARKKQKSYEEIHYTCTIRFLDDSEPITVTYQKDTKGQWLLDYVCSELNLVERDYFGLRFVDAEKQRGRGDPLNHWLDPTKYVYRQMKNVNPMVLCFRVKFYPSEPMKCKEEITRYFLFLQLRRDLHHGRLLCSPSDAILLAAYIIQSEVGDYDPQDHPPGYVAEFKMLPKQTQKQEEKIAEIHKTLTGQVPSEAEGNFLKKACQLDTYGVDPHPVKDQKGNQMYLGITHLGIVTFQGNKRTHLFKWAQINKIAFEGKMFIVHVTVSEGEENSLYYKRKKHACGFKCPTFSACKHVWKCAVQQQYFFTLANSSEAPKVTSGGGWFTRGSKFRFSGRCQKEVFRESETISREPPQFVRSASNPQFVRSYNNLRAATLPSKFKDKSRSINDVVEKNHISASDLPHLVSDVYDEPIDTNMPEQEEVVVSETPYDPLQSPSKEELPPVPAEGSEKPDVIPAMAPDLDTQIQELQTELERCRAVNAVDTATLSATPPGDKMEETTATPVEATLAQPDDVVKDVEPASGGVKSKIIACLRALAAIFFLVFLFVIVLSLVLFESDLQLPVLNDLRQLPEVSHFKRLHYDPFKSSVSETWGGMFKS